MLGLPKLATNPETIANEGPISPVCLALDFARFVRPLVAQIISPAYLRNAILFSETGTFGVPSVTSDLSQCVVVLAVFGFNSSVLAMFSRHSLLLLANGLLPLSETDGIRQENKYDAGWNMDLV